MAREKESWFTNHSRAYSRLINQDERDSIRKYLEDLGGKVVSEPGPRFDKHKELHEEWSLNGDRVFIHTVPVWGKSGVNMRLDSSKGFGRELIRAGVLKRKDGRDTTAGHRNPRPRKPRILISLPLS